MCEGAVRKHYENTKSCVRKNGRNEERVDKYMREKRQKREKNGVN